MVGLRRVSGWGARLFYVYDDLGANSVIRKFRITAIDS